MTDRKNCIYEGESEKKKDQSLYLEKNERFTGKKSKIYVKNLFQSMKVIKKTIFYQFDSLVIL